MSNHALTHCLCCGSPRLQLVLDLGMQPPANSYTASEETLVEPHPLGLNRCEDCWNAQLSFCVDRREIFDRYAYVSGTSRTLTQFFHWFAAALSAALPKGGRVLELAANDGSLIRAMQQTGLSCVGVDPAANIVEAARLNGLPIQCGYWPQAAELVTGPFDAIVCMNVLAHVDDPLAFLAGCTAKLARNGVVVVQPSQARMFENGEFDTIYHEHISFFNTRSMARLAQRAGLRLVGTALVKVHGDSPVYFLQRPDAEFTTEAIQTFRTGSFAIDEALPDLEERIRLFDTATYARFRQQAMDVIEGVQRTVAEHEEHGFDIVFVGAAAKAMTVLNAARIRPDYLLDEAPLKIGLHAPGCGNRVAPLTAASQGKRPALFVLSAWNFRHELTQKLQEQGVPEGSRFYAYLPRPEFIRPRAQALV